MFRWVIVIVSGILCLRSVAAAPFEKTLAPPKALDGIRAGMTVEEARAALAAFAPDDAYRDAAARARLVRDAGDGAKYYVLVKDGVVARIGIEAPQPGLVDRLARLWGKPAQSQNLANESVTSWSSAQWRVDLSCRGALCRMAFHRPLAADFFGAAVAPPGPLAQLRPWFTREALAKAAPRFAAGAEVPAGPEDVRLALDVGTDGRLRSVLVGGLPANARAVIEQAWGAPADPAHPSWWNPSAGWRAQLDENLKSLVLFPYVPAARLLGSGSGIAAFAKPILGATRDQITKAYGGTLALPPIEDSVGHTPVALAYDAQGRAAKLVIQLAYATPARKDELVKLLEAKWGAAKRTGDTYTFPASVVRIQAHDTATTLVLTLTL